MHQGKVQSRLLVPGVMVYDRTRHGRDRWVRWMSMGGNNSVDVKDTYNDTAVEVPQ